MDQRKFRPHPRVDQQRWRTVHHEFDGWRHGVVEKTFDVNVLGLCIATREAIKDMRENQVEGCIININSIMGHYVPAASFLSAYHGSKFAVTAITETLRQELISAGCKIRTTVSIAFSC